LGVGGAKARLEELVRDAVESIPNCPGQQELRKLIKAQTSQFLPKNMALVAA
jgi:geranylgeranyl diphosphate synthase type II